MKKDNKIIISLIAAGAIIFLITKFLKKSSTNNTNTNTGGQSGYPPHVEAFSDPKFIFRNARIASEYIMTFKNYTWSEIIDYIYKYPNDYKQISEFFFSIEKQVQAAWLQRQFKIKYEKDMYKYLQQNLTKNQIIEIADYINSLPEVFQAAKPGEYGDKGYIIKPIR